MLKGGLFSKFFVLALSLSLFIGAIILIATIVDRSRALEEALVRENKLLIKIMASNIETAYRAGFFPFETLKEVSEFENTVFLWIAKPTGEIYFADNPEMWGKIIEDPFLTTEESVVRPSIYPENGREIKLIAYPLRKEIGKRPWTIFLGVSLEEIVAAQRRIIFHSIGFFTGLIIFGTFISFYVAKGITNPLQHLQKGAETIGKGNLGHRIIIKTGDEIEELAKSFNQMAKDLQKSHLALEEAKTTLEIKVQARTKELEELTQALDEKVTQRTKELRERVNELERFQKLTIGRELRMVELKKENEELREEIKRLKKET